MSSTDVLQPSPPEVSGATQAADVPDSLLNQLMDQHEAEVHLQNLQLHSGGGSQETGTEAAIPVQQWSGSPTTPSNLTETMDDSDVTYAPTDDDEEEEDSRTRGVHRDTRVQKRFKHAARSPQSSQMLESHQVSGGACQRFNRSRRAPNHRPTQHENAAELDALNAPARKVQGRERKIARSRVTYVRVP